MNGLWIQQAQSWDFGDLYAPLLPAWNPLWWLTNGSTQVRSDWLNDAENMAFYETADVEFDKHNWFNGLWRPDVMRLFAPRLFQDEWSSLCALNAPNEERARAIAAQIRGPGFVELAKASLQYAEIYICDADNGMVFLFSRNEDWLQTLHRHVTQSEFVEPDVFHLFSWYRSC